MTVFCKWGSYAVPREMEYDRTEKVLDQLYDIGVIRFATDIPKIKAIIRAALDEEVKAGGPYYLSTGEK